MTVCVARDCCFERCVVSSSTCRSRLIFFSTTTSWLGYVRCKACLVQGHMRKLLISAWTLQCTSAARHLALVLGVIKTLRQCRTDMSHSLDRCGFFCPCSIRVIGCASTTSRTACWISNSRLKCNPRYNCDNSTKVAPAVLQLLLQWLLPCPRVWCH